MFRTADRTYRRLSSIGTLPRRSSALAACLLFAFAATAEASEPLIPSEGVLDSGVDRVKERMEEIVVYGSRKKESSDALLADPLRARILKEIRQLNILDEEFEWRLEAARLEATPPRMRVGYDPRNDDRSAPVLTAQSLPLDLMQPATIFSVDF